MPVDTYVPLEKQLKMMKIILYLYDTVRRAGRQADACQPSAGHRHVRRSWSR